MNIETVLATVRRGLPDNAGPAMRHDYETDCEFVARWLVANADKLFVIPPLEWEVHGKSCFCRTPHGELLVMSLRSGKWVYNHPEMITPRTFGHCDSLADGKAKCEQWYQSRVTAALRPAIGKVYPIRHRCRNRHRHR